MAGIGELKERYKLLPAWARLLAAFIIGLMPGAYVFIDESDDLDAKLTTLQGQYDEAKSKFDDASNKKDHLPKLEEQLQFTEEQLAKAKLRLPDHYRIEDVLQKVATIAKQAGVVLAIFDPGQEVKQTQPYPYVELPIASEVHGTFSQTAVFFDRLIHLEGSIFLRRLELTRYDVREERGADIPDKRGEKSDTKTPYELAQEARSNMRVKTKFEVVVFRSMTSQEAATAAPPPAPKGPKPEKKPAAEAPTAKVEKSSVPDRQRTL